MFLLSSQYTYCSWTCQAANSAQLFAFIKADLNAHRPKPESAYAFAEAGSSSSFDPIAEPRFPKSLFLIQPLFSAYELNPVAHSAQASVPIPEGLDLDAWIVPSLQEVVSNVNANGSAEYKVKKSKKGKGKENGTKTKGAKRRQADGGEGVVLAALEQEAETPEEAAERARVCRTT